MNKYNKNAIIMAAGTSSRFAPISYEIPKALIKVKGEVLIERQIRQLKEAGIEQIIVVTGYKSEMFSYLKDKFQVILIENNEYEHRNNNASIYLAQDYISNTYICSADNYFTENPFLDSLEESYYSAVYTSSYVNEWFLEVDSSDTIRNIKFNQEKGWYMLGPAYMDATFSKKFLDILNREYNLEETKNKLWESIYMDHLQELEMKIKKYPNGIIYEFDTLDELREFDQSYVNQADSKILNDITTRLHCEQKDLNHFESVKKDTFEAVGFKFYFKDAQYQYDYATKTIEKVE